MCDHVHGTLVLKCSQICNNSDHHNYAWHNMTTGGLLSEETAAQNAKLKEYQEQMSTQYSVYRFSPLISLLYSIGHQSHDLPYHWRHLATYTSLYKHL